MPCIAWRDGYMLPVTRPLNEKRPPMPMKGRFSRKAQHPIRATLRSLYITHPVGGPSVAANDNAYESRAVVVRGGGPVTRDTGEQATERDAATADENIAPRPRHVTSGASHHRDWETPQDLGRRAHIENPRLP